MELFQDDHFVKAYRLAYAGSDILLVNHGPSVNDPTDDVVVYDFEFIEKHPDLKGGLRVCVDVTLEEFIAIRDKMTEELRRAGLE